VEDLLRQLSQVVLVDRTLTEVLTDITAIAAQKIPGAEASSITLLRDEKAFTAAHSGEMALAADELQYAHGYGPCMDAGRGGVLLRVDDMRTEERWPDYVAHVVASTPVLSSLSVPLPYQGASIGALNNYSTVPGAFASPESIRAGTDVAEVIAVAVAAGDGVAGDDRAGQGRADGPAPRRRRAGLRDPPRGLPALQPQAARHRVRHRGVDAAAPPALSGQGVARSARRRLGE
jgi:hypothetical protein